MCVTQGGKELVEHAHTQRAFTWEKCDGKTAVVSKLELPGTDMLVWARGCKYTSDLFVC